MKKKNVLLKSLLRTIRGSFGRYIAIMAIIILGSSIFVGLLSTKADMVATGQKFVIVSIFHGFVVDFSVPFLVTFFCLM